MIKVILVLSALLVVAVVVLYAMVKNRKRLMTEIDARDGVLLQAEESIEKAKKYIAAHVATEKAKEKTKDEIKDAQDVDDIRDTFDAGLDRLRKLRGES